MEFNRSSSVEWVSMDFNVPINGILREYNEIKDSLITHRPEDGHTTWSWLGVGDKGDSHKRGKLYQVRYRGIGRS